MSDLCPGIRKTVLFLQRHGFNTTDSGDGVSNEGMGCELDHPNVFMLCPPDKLLTESHRLLELLARQGVRCTPDPDGPHIEVSYDPSDGIGILCLFNLDDKTHLLERGDIQGLGRSLFPVEPLPES